MDLCNVAFRMKTKGSETFANFLKDMYCYIFIKFLLICYILIRARFK